MEDLALNIFRPILKLVRGILFLIEWGLIVRPIYWVGWCILKTISTGKLPEYGINEVGEEVLAISIIVWLLGGIGCIGLLLLLYELGIS